MRRTALRHSLLALRLSVFAMLLAGVVLAQQKTMAAAKSSAIALDPSKPVAITGGKLLTITHGTIDNGMLIIDNGKIAAVGVANSVKVPANAQVIDAKGMTVYPGLIDSETHLGLTEIEADR